MTIQFRPYQEDGLQALWQYFMGHSGNPIIAWPTGTGKSLLPAEFIRRTMVNYPSQRFLLSTHVKELILQNAEKLTTVWPNAPMGINSAGLKQRDFIQPIIYGGIQSMYKIATAFGWRDILFIDECQLLSQDDDSMYHVLINALRMINPMMKVIGLSATPYRIGQGLLTDGGLFTHIAHDLTSLENFNKLLADGYLAPLIPKKTNLILDVSNVGTAKGEFIQSQLQHEIDKAEITWKGLQETVAIAHNRRSWLIYATGIEHAEHISEMLNSMGIECAPVHSKRTAEWNEAALKAHKECRLRAIVSYSKLTTGLDHPHVDLIVVFRPTMSVSLWVQLLGRGTRPVYELGYDLNTSDGRLAAIAASTKQNCLVLDFARNTLRLGPINDPLIPKKKGDKGGTVPIKECEKCGIWHHIKAIKCTECDNPFDFEVKIVEHAATEQLIRDAPIIEPPQIEVFDVSMVFYAKKQKKDKNPYIQVTYFCGMNAFKEFVFPENTKFRKPFADWWKMRHVSEPPSTTDNALQFTSELRPPKRIRVHMNKMVGGKNWPEVLSVEY